MGKRDNGKPYRGPRQEHFARQYWPLVPDAEYFALCYRTWRGHSRPYGERVYAYFRIIEGQHAGKVLRLMCSPSIFPTSNFYRAWCIARGGPPPLSQHEDEPQDPCGKNLPGPNGHR